MGGIGNMVLLTPALSMVSKKYPQARFHFLIPKNNSRDIIELHPQTGMIVEISGMADFLFSKIVSLRKLKVDIAISATGTNPFKCGLIGLVSGAKFRLGESFGWGRFLYNLRVPFKQRVHEAAANGAIVKRIIPDGILGKCTIFTAGKDVDNAKQFFRDHHFAGKSCIGFHLGSGEAMSFKRWPTENFIEIGQALLDLIGNDCRIILFGGRDEQELAERAARQIGSHAINTAGILSIRESYELMKHATIVISGDTGPMHLAAAAGCRVIALFGPTDEQMTAPFGLGHHIIAAPLECRSCYSNNRPITCTFRHCLTDITVAAVLSQVTRMLDRSTE